MSNQYKTHVAVIEKCTIIAKILKAVAQLQLEF